MTRLRIRTAGAAALWIVLSGAAAVFGLPGWSVISSLLAMVAPAALIALVLHNRDAPKAAPPPRADAPIRAQAPVAGAWRRDTGVVPVRAGQIPAATLTAHPTLHPAAPPPRAEETSPTAMPPRQGVGEFVTGQEAFGFATEPAHPSPGEIALALDFARSPDDRQAIAAMRRCLADPDLARLIRAAQDAIVLMGQAGLYAGDVVPVPGRIDLWRRFAAGERGRDFAALAPRGEAEIFALASDRLREDEVLRDAVHHFLRRFDAMLGRVVPLSDDATVQALVAGTSGRTFALMARAVGTFG